MHPNFKKDQDPSPNIHPDFTMRTLYLISALALVAINSAAAFSVPFHRSDTPDPILFSIVQRTFPKSRYSIQDSIYVVDVQIDGGFEFQLQLDTSTSDIWVDASYSASLKDFVDTNVDVGISTLDVLSSDLIEGDVWITSFQLGDWKIPSQAYLNTAFRIPGPVAGVLGLAPAVLVDSQIAKGLEGTENNGFTFIDNFFSEFPDVEHYITFLFNRSDVDLNPEGGKFTIGSVVSGFENILQSPKITVLPAGQWLTVVDDFIINGSSLISGIIVPPLAIRSVWNTGAKTSTGPSTYINAMYSHASGAQFDNSTGVWTFPCDSSSQVNVSFVFNNQIVPINPLDLGYPDHVDANGTAICVGTFLVDDGFGANPFVLGDAFLRNTYTMFGFGDLVDGGSGTPYIKILPVTDDSEITKFAAANEQRVAVLSEGTSSTSHYVVSGSAAEDSGSKKTFINIPALHRSGHPYLVAGLVGTGIIVLIVVIVMSCSKSKPYTRVGTPGSVPHNHGDN